jgi:hypothetical protein
MHSVKDATFFSRKTTLNNSFDLMIENFIHLTRSAKSPNMLKSGCNLFET